MFADEKSVTAKSSLPSLLKSPAAMPLVPIPAGKSILGYAKRCQISSYSSIPVSGHWCKPLCVV